jgi:glycogen debranching enzyme
MALFHRGTRYLSHLYLTVDAERPLLLSSTLRDDNASLTCDLTNPNLFDPVGMLILQHDLLHLPARDFLWNGACYERWNFDERLRQVGIDINFAADFADLFEVRRARRHQGRTTRVPDVGTAPRRRASNLRPIA